MSHLSPHLQRLEDESIYILREVAAEFRRPVMLYSVGKDSSVMLHLARKAFFPGRPPFPFLHIASGWDFRALNFDGDVDFAYRKVGWVMDATSPDLRSFRARGGKLIQYHGWGDAAIAPGSSVDYYEQVRSFFATYPDPRAPAGRPVEDFYRLFMVPGMAHCGGGVGPYDFGNGAPVAGAGPDRDIVAALDRWVEQGVAPDELIGRGVAPGKTAKPMTRLLCPYPRVARYAGTGDPWDAASFSCQMPPPAAP